MNFNTNIINNKSANSFNKRQSKHKLRLIDIFQHLISALQASALSLNNVQALLYRTPVVNCITTVKSE